MLRPAKAAQSQQHTIDIKASDRQRLKAFMSHELAMYNRLNTELVKLLRRDPKILADITPGLIEVYSAIATGDNIQYQPGTDILTDTFGNTKTNPAMRFIVTEGLNKIAVHADVKKSFVTEILKMYVNTAKAMTNTKATSVQQEFLESLDENRKRHVQLHKSHINMSYNADIGKTVLTTPYTEHPITIAGDITRDTTWNYAIIHQKPGRPATTDTPWLIDLRSVTEKYLLKYQEMLNPYGSSVHHHAARNFKCVSF